MGLVLAGLVGIGLLGCGSDTPSVDTNDTTPPDSLVMDANIPQGTTNTVVTVTPTSGDKSFAPTGLPTITLLASAHDGESSIGELRIDGETTVICQDGDLGQSKHATWLRKAPITQPAANPIAQLPVDLGQLAQSCDPGSTFKSLAGKFFATATNGAGKRATTARFSFSR